ncbi:hypothetical protein MRB53_038586 [Persea americana]|nr:hypothetical protein MRB53_038586 [Persea americana]
MEAISIDDDLPAALSGSALQQGSRFEELSSNIDSLQAKLTDLFEPYKQVKYRLQAVFFHRGKTAHGHYWICIRDFQKGVWRKYNDERVDEIPNNKLHEIYEANEWIHGTPTYAVYVRDDLKQEIVQPVCRQLVQPQEPNEQMQGQLDGQTAHVEEIVADPSLPQQSNGQTATEKTSVESNGIWDAPREVPADGRW